MTDKQLANKRYWPANAEQWMQRFTELDVDSPELRVRCAVLFIAQQWARMNEDYYVSESLPLGRGEIFGDAFAYDPHDETGFLLVSTATAMFALGINYTGLRDRCNPARPGFNPDVLAARRTMKDFRNGANVIYAWHLPQLVAAFDDLPGRGRRTDLMKN